MPQVRRMAQALKPAILCFSMLLTMLGTMLILVALLALWMRAPEQVSLHQLTPEAAIVRGGEQLGLVLHYMRGEVLSAMLLFLAGLLGLSLSRRQHDSPAWAA